MNGYPERRDELTKAIIACCFEVHNKLGSGFLENVYRSALALELRKNGLRPTTEVPVAVLYDGEIVGQYFADVVVNDAVVCELKACDRLTRQHEAQLVNYLAATGIAVGLLINFGESVAVKRKFRVYTRTPGTKVQTRTNIEEAIEARHDSHD